MGAFKTLSLNWERRKTHSCTSWIEGRVFLKVLANWYIKLSWINPHSLRFEHLRLSSNFCTPTVLKPATLEFASNLLPSSALSKQLPEKITDVLLKIDKKTQKTGGGSLLRALIECFLFCYLPSEFAREKSNLINSAVFLVCRLLPLVPKCIIDKKKWWFCGTYCLRSSLRHRKYKSCNLSSFS